MGLPVRQLRQVECQKLGSPFGDEDGRYLRPCQSPFDRFGRRCPHDDRTPGLVRLLERGLVRDVVQHERVVQVELSLDSNLRHAPAGGSEPALPQTVVVSPGSSAITSTPGACSRSSSGVPASSGKVPKWEGMQRFAPSSSSATPASRGSIVKWPPMGKTATSGE